MFLFLFSWNILIIEWGPVNQFAYQPFRLIKSHLFALRRSLSRRSKHVCRGLVVSNHVTEQITEAHVVFGCSCFFLGSGNDHFIFIPVDGDTGNTWAVADNPAELADNWNGYKQELTCFFGKTKIVYLAGFLASRASCTRCWCNIRRGRTPVQGMSRWRAQLLRRRFPTRESWLAPGRERRARTHGCQE